MTAPVSDTIRTDLVPVMEHGHACPIADEHYKWAVAEIKRLRAAVAQFANPDNWHEEAGLQQWMGKRDARSFAESCLLDGAVIRAATAASEEIAKAVDAVLAEGKWPIHQTYDDMGLDREGYIELVGEVLAKMPPCSPENHRVGEYVADYTMPTQEQLAQPLPSPVNDGDMRAFGASDAACYKWPDDTPEHKALRAAYCEGAADCGGVVLDPKQISAVLKRAWEECGQVPFPLYATEADEMAAKIIRSVTSG